MLMLALQPVIASLLCFRRDASTMIPDADDTLNDGVREKKNTSFICGVIEGTSIKFFL